MGDVKGSIEKAVRYLSEHPDEARYTDSLATARLGDSLRVDVQGPNGERISTDMPGGIGGKGEEPGPAWLYRAGLAACVASVIGMEAAREGIELTSLEVEVDSESDDHGILGMDESVPAGPLSVRVAVRGTADGVEASRLREILERGVSRCPVYEGTQRAVDVNLELETG